MKEKGDPCIFVGYSTQSNGYRVYNKRTRLIIESIHINFDDLKEVMTLDYDNSGPAPQLQKASDHNRSKPGIQDHNNEPSSSTLALKVVPPADEKDTSLQECESYYCYSNVDAARLKLKLFKMLLLLLMRSEEMSK
nr:integrase, catalytic region, zinc finger, CCHC-type, peptidase aspartic, catalytic [Tanacetum cinerariifolium]